MSAIETRYAEAILAAAGDTRDAQIIGDMLREVSDAMESSSELRYFMFNPVVPAEAKKAVLKQILPGDSPALGLNFLSLLVDKERFSRLSGILDEYKIKMARLNGVLRIMVTSACPLEQRQIDEIAATYQRKHGSEHVLVETRVVPSLLGGIRVQIGDVLTDDSLSGRLRGLRSCLISGRS